MRKIRTLIVDDEEHARYRVRDLLAAAEDVDIIGECTDGLQAVVAIESLQPDLVYLDVQMPEMDGFQVLRALDPELTPVVVFVTAHDEFALRAFDAYAADYLLKPFHSARFASSLDRARC